MQVLATALALLLGTQAIATDGGLRTLFMCPLRNGHFVRVATSGNDFVYQYGKKRRAQLQIAGTPTSGNVLWMEQRLVGLEHQMRFKKGAYSYIVYTHGENRLVGTRAFSGLVVTRGQTRIADYECSKFAVFKGAETVSNGASPYDQLPKDALEYSAM